MTKTPSPASKFFYEVFSSAIDFSHFIPLSNQIKLLSFHCSNSLGESFEFMDTDDSSSDNASRDVDSSVSSRTSNEADKFTYSQERMVRELAILLCVEGIDFGLSEKFAFMRFVDIASNPKFLPYSHELMVKELTRLIFTEEIQINLGQSVFFLQFMRKALNPNFREITTKEVVNEAKKEFKSFKNELRLTFSSRGQRVSLACDVWRNKDAVDYICVTAHWIDCDWSMQRRIVSVKDLYPPVCADEIYDPIKQSIDSLAISDKISSVTVDEIVDNDEVMEDLKKFTHPILDGKLFRVRCVCRVLSSCILHGLDIVKVHIRKVRKACRFPFTDRQKYIVLCEKYGLEPKFNFPWTDMLSWDDTREMLKRSVQYKDVFNEYSATCGPDSIFQEIDEQDSEVVSVYIRFLDVFYEAVDFVSRNYYPSSSGVLLHLVNIANLFSEYRGSLVFEEKISGMEEKFLEHYRRIPDLFCLAAVMDPRIKLSGCECLVESYYRCINNTEVNVEQEKKAVYNLLHEMFNEYASKASRSGSEQPSSPEASAPLNSSGGFAWSLISGKKRKTTDSGFDELAFYLQSPVVLEKEKIEEFDILGWWKNNEATYPVLAGMARDLLTTAVSTLAPECAFVRNNERNIMGKSYRYRWKLLELSICLRDWFNAEMRTQGVRYPAVYEDYGADEDDE